MSESRTPILFVRPQCHLCHHARAMLSELCIPFNMINIDNHANWQAQYATLVPVLYAPWCDKELVFPFTAAEVNHWLTNLPD